MRPRAELEYFMGCSLTSEPSESMSRLTLNLATSSTTMPCSFEGSDERPAQRSARQGGTSSPNTRTLGLLRMEIASYLPPSSEST